MSVADAEVDARALSVCEDALVAGVSPAATIGSDREADEPLILSTPEETVTTRLSGATSDLHGTLLSFERLDG